MIEQRSLHTDQDSEAGKPVECLGMTFPNDEARRAYFLQKLREMLQDPEFRKIDGFPIATDEDILALSDPPYYTACPNPFIADFITCYGKPYDAATDQYHVEPFAADTSAGKFDPIYRSHSYHTKVPYIAIQEYLRHYVDKQAVILDAFCGSGMTGVAVRKLLAEGSLQYPILIDISPEATFIASRMMTKTNPNILAEEHARVAESLALFTDSLYKIQEDTTTGEINYTVWSDVFLCPDCTGEIVFWDIAVEPSTGSMRSSMHCPHCHIALEKRQLHPRFESYYDDLQGETARRIMEVPVVINYSVGGKRRVKKPSEADMQVLALASEMRVPFPVPTNRMPEGDESRRNDPAGMTHVHHFYTRRMLIGLSVIWHELQKSSAKPDLHFMLSRLLPRASKLHKWKMGQTTGITTGTLYVPSLRYEYNVNKMWNETIDYAMPVLTEPVALPFIVSTQSATQLTAIPDSCIDYIFTDPPFGGNLSYSDLNFIWESWLRNWTARESEAIVSRSQGKGLFEYAELMKKCMSSYLRVLKPGRWMTLVFHNSLNSVWAAIQEALGSAGFIVADIRTLDKKQKSFKQIQGASAVKQDLIISAYKPSAGLEERFKLEAGTANGVWDFVQAHLWQLPVFVPRADRGEVIAERLPYLLFDRMVGFHVQRNVSVPLSASEFYAGLAQRFPERDGMYFLPEQVSEYERKRMTVREVQQLEIFVSNEASAIQWVRQQLTNKPQTTSELTPQFMRELSGWQKHEAQLELRDLLEENFLSFDGNDPIPPQIIGWIKKSADLRELIGREGRELEDGSVETDNPQLKARAKDRWYVPNPNRAIDLEKLRTKGLLREFAAYQTSKGKLKQFRTEAMRAGFKQAWAERDYATIVQMAERLPESVLQEDPELLMYYDNASLRVS